MMLNIDEIEITEEWDMTQDICNITAEAKVTGRVSISKDDINAHGGDLRKIAKVTCALRVFDSLYGDLRDDVYGAIDMLKRSHPDQVAVAELEHRLHSKLGKSNG